MPAPDDLTIRHFRNQKAWEKWLLANTDGKGVWLQIAKKDSGIASVNYAEALEVALCHGWIDGQKRGHDEQFFLQRFTPRRPRSLWSKINIGHVERLMAAGRMQAGGLREVEAAKADGRWDAAYQSSPAWKCPPNSPTRSWGTGRPGNSSTSSTRPAVTRSAGACIPRRSQRRAWRVRRSSWRCWPGARRSTDPEESDFLFLRRAHAQPRAQQQQRDRHRLRPVRCGATGQYQQQCGQQRCQIGQAAQQGDVAMLGAVVP